MQRVTECLQMYVTHCILKTNFLISTYLRRKRDQLPANSPWQEQDRAPAQQYDDLCSCAFPPQRVWRRTRDESRLCSTIDGAGIHWDLETLLGPVMLQIGTG